MKLDLFKINYYKYKINDWSDKKHKLLDLINFVELNNKKNILDKNQTQISTFFSNTFDVYDILQKDLIDFTNEINFDINFLNSWYQIYDTNDYHNLHNHGILPKQYSGILFLQFDKIQHKSTAFLNPYLGVINQTFFYPEVEEGDLIIFPSSLMHQAPINKSDQKRIIISFNMELLDYPKDPFKNNLSFFSYYM